MSNNDYFTIAYKVLSYLKYCYEEDQKISIDVLRPETFNISNMKFNRTLVMLQNDGYITGISTTSTSLGEIVSGVNQIQITSAGLQYLKENSMMQKAYRKLKEVRDWLPKI